MEKLPKVVGPKDDHDVNLNHYKVKSRQPLSTWKENGWIYTDKGGWFHWYCLYYLGRRLGKEDDKQVARWKSFVARHMGQVASSCNLKTDSCHTKQRQGLLQWAWDSTTTVDPKQLEKNLKSIAKKAGAKVSISMENLIPPSASW